MNDKHHFMTGILGGAGWFLGWLGAHEAVINAVIGKFSMYGGAFMVAVSIYGWVNHRIKIWKAKHKKNL